MNSNNNSLYISHVTKEKKSTMCLGEVDNVRRTCLMDKIGVLKNFTIFKGKHLCWISFY